ncbi:MAG: hypothetical protein ABGW83_07175, partial [Flavobacteriaceae bacterium]
MVIIKNKIFLFFLIIILCFSTKTFASKDNYPKNPKIDAINYAFNIELSDKSDQIICEVIIDIRFLGSGVKILRLDLINASNKLENKGMIVSEVSSDGKALSFSHKNNELLIDLPEPSSLNQFSKFKVKYKGIPHSGLIIGENKYGDR